MATVLDNQKAAFVTFFSDYNNPNYGLTTVQPRSKISKDDVAKGKRLWDNYRKNSANLILQYRSNLIGMLASYSPQISTPILNAFSDWASKYATGDALKNGISGNGFADLQTWYNTYLKNLT